MNFSSPIIVCISVCAIGIATFSCVCEAYAAGKREVATTDSLHTHPLDEVVVTGSNNATSRNLLPYTVSVVGSRQIESTGHTQLLSALSGEVPSFFVSQRSMLGFGVSNGGSGAIKIRGVGGSPTNAILMMVDGQPQFAGIYSHHVADFYQTENVDHVEVLRGPGSVLYGSNAMGGVVNVITKQAQTEGVKTTLTSQYGSYNTWQTSLTNMVRKGRFSSLVSLGYDRTDGTQDHFDFKQSSLYAKLGYDLTSHLTLAADYSLMNFVGNDPIYAKLSNPESTDIYHQDVIRGESSLSLTNRFASTNGVVRVYYSYGNHFIDDPRHFHSLDDRFGVLTYQNFNPWKAAQATVGFDFDTYTGKIPVSGGREHQEGSISTMNRKSITEYSPYITLSQGLWEGLLTLNGGLRMANSDRFGTHYVPQLGFALHPTEALNVKVSMAKGYRNPSFREMYLYRPANEDLDPERLTNYEVGISYQFGRYLIADMTGYFSEGSNLIQTVEMKNVNTGRFINKGIELSLQSHPVENVLLRASYSYLHSNLNNLTAAPKNQYYFGVTWEALPQLSVDANLKGVGGLYVSDAVAHQNYVLLQMKATYRVKSWAELFVNLDNLTNAKYTINRGYEMPGTTISGGFRLHF